MRYVSTRGEAPELDFGGVVLAGLAADGGLYVPASFPELTAEQLAGFRGRPFAEVAAEVMAPFTAPTLSHDELLEICRETYGRFSHADVAPLHQLSPTLHVLELFHGPTLAFKDVALQLLGRLFDRLLAERGERATILGATSGDTGSAAIEGCRGRDLVDIVILHPHGRTSEVQRRQMTTVHDANVHNLAVEGDFDACQAIVKQLFRDPAARADLRLTAVNSINWARVLAQIVYYVTAAVALGAPERSVSFVVPTGNFGDVLAGWYAKQMGVPIHRLVVATNGNDILARTLDQGRYDKREVKPTLSPSMDIQVSSNFERLLFEVHGRDASRIRGLMASLSDDDGFGLESGPLDAIRADFDAGSAGDARTLEVIREVHQTYGYLVDPHTAVGVSVAWEQSSAVPQVVLATAHPAKFPDAVSKATGVHPPLPEHLDDLYEREERYQVVPASAGDVEAFLRGL
jgi:threonine synthase